MSVAAVGAAMCFAVLASAPARAQDSALAVGERVRLTTAAARRYEGTVASLDGNALTLLPRNAAAQMNVPWRDISVLEARRKRPRVQGALNRAKWGAIAGAATALLFLVTPAADTSIAPGAAALEALGSFTVTGALIGAIFPGSRWRPLHMEGTRRAAVRGGTVAERAPDATRSGRPRAFRRGTTPLGELSVGVNFPQFRYAQFPGLVTSLAVNVTKHPRLGAALVAEGDASLLRPAWMGGVRVYARNRPLFDRRHTLTAFAHGMAGRVDGHRSGVVESTGGSATQVGAGVDYGVGRIALRLQADYRSVPGGVVRDDRVTTGPVDSMSGERISVSWVLRFGSR